MTTTTEQNLTQSQQIAHSNEFVNETAATLKQVLELATKSNQANGETNELAKAAQASVEELKAATAKNDQGIQEILKQSATYAESLESSFETDRKILEQLTQNHETAKDVLTQLTNGEETLHQEVEKLIAGIAASNDDFTKEMVQLNDTLEELKELSKDNNHKDELQQLSKDLTDMTHEFKEYCQTAKEEQQAFQDYQKELLTKLLENDAHLKQSELVNEQLEETAQKLMGKLAALSTKVELIEKNEPEEPVSDDAKETSIEDQD